MCWRAAGLTYIDYSRIAARLVRRSYKSELQTAAFRREATHIKFTPWVDGKPVKKGE